MNIVLKNQSKSFQVFLLEAAFSYGSTPVLTDVNLTILNYCNSVLPGRKEHGFLVVSYAPSYKINTVRKNEQATNQFTINTTPMF